MSIPAAVSYIVPVYNGERYLAQCIESILGQIVPPVEIIVVDDGSTDGSAQVAAGFGDRVSYVRQPRAGQSAARNLGVRLAAGDFLAFLDSDDLIHPTKLAMQLERFAARPTLELCDAYVRNFWSPEIPETERGLHARQKFTHSEQPRGHSIDTWLLRRELFEAVGGFNEQMPLGEDTDWYERVKESGARIETLDEILAFRRLHGRNLTLQRYDDFLREILRSHKRRIAQIRKNS